MRPDTIVDEVLWGLKLEIKVSVELVSPEASAWMDGHLLLCPHRAFSVPVYVLIFSSYKGHQFILEPKSPFVDVIFT